MDITIIIKIFTIKLFILRIHIAFLTLQGLHNVMIYNFISNYKQFPINVKNIT